MVCILGTEALSAQTDKFPMSRTMCVCVYVCCSHVTSFHSAGDLFKRIVKCYKSYCVCLLKYNQYSASTTESQQARDIQET